MLNQKRIERLEAAACEATFEELSALSDTELAVIAYGDDPEAAEAQMARLNELSDAELLALAKGQFPNGGL